MEQTLWMRACQFLEKLNMYLPTIAILGIYPTEMKTHGHPKFCTRMFIATLFIISPKPETSKMCCIG